ncbi:hypothetical protein C8R44DRAFT_371686 [Mycena epipterygia]|nr:hypothetical protein C8R44DRAFT_371686 [Mycena epipterygia]
MFRSFQTQIEFDLHKTAIAALVFLVWENLITFDDEVEHIWSKPKTAWVKTVFLFLRYFTLAVQLCNRILDEKVINHDPLGYSALRAWYISQVVVAHLIMTATEFVMMARVYALYHNNRWVGWGFVCLLLGETFAVIAGLFITLPGVHFEPGLLVGRVPHSFAYLGISALVSQAIILVLTLLRFLRGQWAGTSLGTLLIRDGSIVYLIFFVTTLSAVIYSIRGVAFGMTEYAWYLSIVSSVGCRLILNMHRLPSRRRVSDSSFHGSSNMELTTLHDDAYTFHNRSHL